MSELEELSRLVGGDDIDPVDTAGLLENSLRASLGAATSEKIREMESEIRNSGDVVESNKLRKVATQSKSAPSNDASMEKLLIALCDIREGLVGSFETCGINSKTATLLSEQINRLATCIRYIGGEAEKFEPLNHISGLSVPNFYKNAQKVIETTIQCYSLGEVKNAKVEENGNKIAIEFSGTDGEKSYTAFGKVSSEEWMGNEAIDYIYTPQSGKMSVKAFENGRWIDKSNSGKYQVYWELEESNINAVVDNTNVKKASKEESVEKQEIVEGNMNINPEENSRENGEEDIGSPLR